MPQRELFKIIDEDFGDILTSKYLLKFFAFGTVKYKGTILVAFTQFNKDQTSAKGQDTLQECWREVNSYLAANVVATIPSEFSKWNFYLFYVCDKVDKALKYEIENNKFSSRKIVIESPGIKMSDKMLNRLISEHITNEDLTTTTTEKTAPPDFIKNPIITAAIGKLTPNYKKRETEVDLNRILKQIETNLQP